MGGPLQSGERVCFPGRLRRHVLCSRAGLRNLEGPVWTPSGSHLGQVPGTRAARPAVSPSSGRGAGLLGSRGQGPAPPAAPRKASPLQPVPPLELEALRLSLSHMHTARLELTQATLQKEKEAALTELRDALSGRHAQELALLQSRWRLELELAREQHAREQEAQARRRRQEAGVCRGPPGPPRVRVLPCWPLAFCPRPSGSC